MTCLTLSFSRNSKIIFKRFSHYILRNEGLSQIATNYKSLKVSPFINQQVWLSHDQWCLRIHCLQTTTELPIERRVNWCPAKQWKMVLKCFLERNLNTVVFQLQFWGLDSLWGFRFRFNDFSMRKLNNIKVKCIPYIKTESVTEHGNCVVIQGSYI